MKRIGVVFLLLGIIVLISGLAVSADAPTPTPTHGKPAEPPGQQKKTDNAPGKGPHSVSGTVTAKSADAFTVLNKKGESVTVKVLPTTRFQIPGRKDYAFAELQISDRVAVNGSPTGVASMDAKKVGVVPGKPSVQHRVGTVEEFVVGKSITIKTVQGTTEKFLVTSETEIRGEGTIEKGDRVTIVSRRNPGANEFTAQAIVIQSK